MDIHPKRLYGPELIAKVKMSAKLRKAALVLRCGYAKVSPGLVHILPDYEASYTSLIEAQRAGAGPRLRSAMQQRPQSLH